MVGDLFAATSPTSLQITETFGLTRPLSRFTVGRVVFSGDAAHVMTPDLGEGVDQALEDARVLGDVLDGATPHELTERLDRYDAERRPATSRLRAVTHVAHTIATLRGLPGLARDAALRLLPPVSKSRTDTSLTR